MAGLGSRLQSTIYVLPGKNIGLFAPPQALPWLRWWFLLVAVVVVVGIAGASIVRSPVYPGVNQNGVWVVSRYVLIGDVSQFTIT